MSDGDVEMVLVCARTDTPSYVPSLTGTCSECGHEVWMSVRMQIDPKVRAMRVMCAVCAFKRAADNPPIGIAVHPTAAAEVREYFENKGKENKEGPVQ